MKKFQWRRIALLVLSLTVFFSLSVAALIWFHTKIYQKFESPDKRYVITVYAFPHIIAMPGQSGDALGLVMLTRHSDGAHLEWQLVDAVELIDVPEWHSDHVEIKLFADWELK